MNWCKLKKEKMSDLRRQRRKAIRESQKAENKTPTKIDDGLAAMLHEYLQDERYFKKQLELCKELNLDYPQNAKTGYELPLFNKNPLTNEIEIHARSADLFTAYQLLQMLVDKAIGLDDESEEYKALEVFMVAIDRSVDFALYLHNLFTIAQEKNKAFEDVFTDNEVEILIKLDEIFVEE